LIAREARKYIQVLGSESAVSRDDGVNDPLVDGPDAVPLHGHLRLGRSLEDDELLEGLDRQSSSSDTSDGRESSVVPAGNLAVVDELVELSLGEEGVDKVESTGSEHKSIHVSFDSPEEEAGKTRREDAREVPEVRLSDVKSVDEPHVLRVPVSVLVRPESMSNAFKRVDHGAGKVVGRVGEVLGSVAIDNARG
jgi:hypothetical protein